MRSLGRWLLGCGHSGAILGLTMALAKAQDVTPSLPTPAGSATSAQELSLGRSASGPNLPASLISESSRPQAERLVRAAIEHRSAGRWRAALDATGQAIATDPTYRKAYGLRADLFEEKELYAHGIATMSDALAIDPTSAISWGKRGRLRCYARDAAGGLADLERGIELAAGGPEAEVIWLRRTRAFALGELGADRRCVAEYDALVASGPPVMTDHHFRGLALLRLREWDPAVADLERAAELVSEDQEVLDRGYARLRAGRFAGALADYELARVADPESREIQVGYALALFAIGRRNEAISYLDHCLGQSPTDPLILTARGWTELLLGDVSRAHRWLNQAVEQPGGRFALGGSVGWLLKEPQADPILADFEARARTTPNLPFAIYYRSGTAARTASNPRAECNAALVLRFPRAADVAPMMIVWGYSECFDQPWRPAAHLGELIASACLLDRAKLRDAVENMFVCWHDPRPIPRPDQLWNHESP